MLTTQNISSGGGSTTPHLYIRKWETDISFLVSDETIQEELRGIKVIVYAFLNELIISGDILDILNNANWKTSAGYPFLQ